MTPRHLALLLPELEAGGAQRVMLLLAREFAARGHRVDLVLLQASGPLLSQVPPNVRLVNLAARSSGLGQIGFAISSIRRLWAWLDRERPDAMLSTLTGANLVAILASRLMAKPPHLVVREAITLDNVKDSLRLAAMRRLYPLADLVVGLTPVMIDELSRTLKVPAHKLRRIPNPIDIAAIRRQSQQPLAHPWGADSSRKLIISAGRLIPQKDFQTLLRAFALLRASTPARLVIVGDGPQRPALEQLAAELGITEDLCLPGFDPNPWRWMAHADLFVLSSRWEGHPNALLEALALGLPAVITEYDASARDFAKTAGTTLVPAADPRRLADAIVQALSGSKSDQTAPPADISPAIDAYLALL